MIKRYIFIGFIVVLTLGLVSCTKANPNPPGTQVFTVVELAQYNGLNGSKAYVAVNGVVYDVSNVPQWNSGAHNGLHAGQDLSSAINSAPHGSSVLKNLKIVGSLVK